MLVPDEARLQVLLELAVLDTGREQVYEDAVAVAAAVCGTPMAAITLLDLHRQWFKAQVGLGTSETPRSWSFCEHAMAAADPVFEVPDALLDERFADNPLVVGDPNVRFYAGAPLVLSDGQAVGALCVLDDKVNALTADQRAALTALGRQVEALLEARRVSGELARAVRERDTANAAAQAAVTQVAAVFNGVAAGMMLIQRDGVVTVANPAMAMLLNTTQDQLTGRPVLELIAERDRRGQDELLTRLFCGGAESVVHEVTFLRDDETEHVVIATTSLVRGGGDDDDQAPRSVVMRCESIADRRLAEVELREAQSALDGIVTVDADERIVSWNEGAARLFGHPRLAAVGRDLSLIVPPAAHAAHARGFARLSAGAPPVLLGTTVELDALKADGSLFPIELSLSRWYRGVDPYYTAVIRDITERRRSQAEQLWRTTHDQTTELGNLAGLRLWCDTNLPLAASLGRSVAMVSLHVTGLGSVAAAMGPLATESLLADVGCALRAAATVDIEFFHLGESHFAGLAHLDATPPTEVPGGNPLSMTERLQQIAHFVLNAMTGPFTADDTPIELDARVGVVAAIGATDAEDLLRRAEAVHTTSARRINVSTSAATDRFAVTRDNLHLLSDLRRAIPAGELELYYQPLICTGLDADGDNGQGTRPGRPTRSAEALIRWNHPTRGLLQPGQFIALAENSTLITPLTEWVLHQACRQSRDWSAAGLDVRIAVNVSPRVLVDDDVVAMVGDALTATGCPSAQLKIEITESAIIADPDQARDTVTALRHIGVEVSIDDFGTGFTSLDLLRTLDISEIKLDRTFVATAITNPADHAIVTTVIDLAHRLGVDAVAEGVEDEPTERLLRNLGYDYLQGYLFSRPLPVDQATRWLTNPPRPQRGSAHPLPNNRTNIAAATVRHGRASYFALKKGSRPSVRPDFLAVVAVALLTLARSGPLDHLSRRGLRS